MAEPMWYYAKGGAKVGPVPLAVLKQMAAAGLVAAVDPVLAEGGTEWAAARSVPGLFPPPPEPAGVPLVTCGRCQDAVSDVAEVCPHCGHPQPPLEAKKNDEEMAPCRFCGTTNPVRSYLHLCRGECRGCGRPVPEAYPRQAFEWQVDEAYQRCRKVVGMWSRWVGGVGAVFGVFATIMAFVPLLGSGWLSSVPALPGGVVGYFTAAGLFAFAVGERYRRRSLPPPNAGRAASREDWSEAGWRADRWDEQLVRLRREHGYWWPPPWWGRVKWTAVWVGVGVGFPVMMCCQAVGVADKKAAEEVRAGSAMADGLSARKNEGWSTHRLSFANESKAAYRGCDLEMTVVSGGTSQPPVKLSWAEWAAGETKAVSVPARGAIERVRLTGVIVDAASGQKGKVAATFDWTAKKPASGK